MMTVSASQNNSRVISLPLKKLRTMFGSRSLRDERTYIQVQPIALCADLDVAAGRILDRRQRLIADRPRRHLFRIEAAEPFAPVRPPRALVFLRALDPVRQRNVLDVVVGPELVLARGGRIDD